MGKSRAAKPAAEARKNPFDSFRGSARKDVVGRKLKGAMRVTSSAKTKALKRRQESLLHEFNRHENNNQSVVIDRRFGERNKNISSEDKALLRFQKQRQRQMGVARQKRGLQRFNLEEGESQLEESLGQSVGNDEAEPWEQERDPNEPRTKKEVMHDIIQKSKMYKAESADRKAEMEEKRLDLNAQLTPDLMSLLETLADQSEPQEVEQDDYERLTKELMYDSKARAEDRTKTEDEIALEEKEKLEKLEAERVRRMQMPTATEEEDQEPEIDPEFVLDSSDSDEETEVAPKTPKAAESVDSEIPFVLGAPEDLDELVQLIQSRSPDEVALILERIHKCNHDKLSPANKQEMQRFMSLHFELLPCLHELFAEEHWLRLVSIFAGSMYDLAKTQTVPFIALCRQRLLKVQKAVLVQNRFPNPAEMGLFLCLSHIFPTTDFEHPVSTPLLLLIADLLREVPVQGMDDAAIGLLLCRLAVDMIADSGKWMPEMFLFLENVLAWMSTSSHTWTTARERQRIWNVLLPSYRLTESIFAANVSDIVDSAMETVRHVESADQILFGLVAALEALGDALPSQLCEKSASIVAACNVSREHLVVVREVPQLRMLEPKFDEDYRPERDSTKDDVKRLKKQLHKEEKGARREIRRDTMFIAQEKRKRQDTEREERKAKQKEVLQFMEEQARDSNLLQKLKKKRR